MIHKRKLPFDPKVFLSKINGGRTVSRYGKNQVVCALGDPADSLYIQSGKVKATVVSEQGKEAVQGRPAGTDHREDQSGDTRRDDRNNSIARESLHARAPRSAGRALFAALAICTPATNPSR
jgi:CRP-like cAMP-binding protein